MTDCVKINIDDGFLNLMTQDGIPKDDVKLPEGEIGEQINTQFDDGKDLLVTIVSAMGEEQVSFFFGVFGGFWFSSPPKSEERPNAGEDGMLMSSFAFVFVGDLLQGGSQGQLNGTLTPLPLTFPLFYICG